MQSDSGCCWGQQPGCQSALPVLQGEHAAVQSSCEPCCHCGPCKLPSLERCSLAWWAMQTDSECCECCWGHDQQTGCQSALPVLQGETRECAVCHLWSASLLLVFLCLHCLQCLKITQHMMRVLCTFTTFTYLLARMLRQIQACYLCLVAHVRIQVDMPLHTYSLSETYVLMHASYKIPKCIASGVHSIQSVLPLQ